MYLLRSLSDRDAVYVGQTSKDPRFRLEQHNGLVAGGATATRTRRPWAIVCVVDGFLTQRDALAFEFAWQHPCMPPRVRSRILRLRGLFPWREHFNLLRARTSLHDKDAHSALDWKVRVLTTILTIDAFNNANHQRRRVRWSSRGRSARRKSLLFATQNVDRGWPMPGPIRDNLPYPAPEVEVLVVEESEDDSDDVIVLDD